MQQHLTESYNREIERLYRLDYGQVGEYWFRMIGSLIGAGIIWLYTGWMAAWVWIAAYAVLQLAFFLFLRAKIKHATATDVRVAHVIFPSMLASYVWMPILMITSPDDALSVSGFCILSGVIVFVVRRSEEYMNMMLFEIAVVALCLGVGAVVIMVRYDNPLAWLGLTFGVGTLIFYVTQNALIVRQQRMRAEEVAARTSQAEKLEAIGKLAGGVAHDFNNLLTVILGNLDLIREVDDPKVRDELLEDARSAALRGAKVVRQLLSYARQTDGTPRVVEVSGLLRATDALCKTLIPMSIALEVMIPSEEMGVRVDDALFVAAMLNLIKNGVDAMTGPGQITVSARARQLVQPLKCAAGQTLLPGHFVAFAVADTGHGIAASDLGRVTDPFFTTKAVGKGSGLGLSMVAGFAMQAGGGLEIQSSAKGTVVAILLPAMTPTP